MQQRCSLCNTTLQQYQKQSSHSKARHTAKQCSYTCALTVILVHTQSHSNTASSVAVHSALLQPVPSPLQQPCALLESLDRSPYLATTMAHQCTQPQQSSAAIRSRTLQQQHEQNGAAVARNRIACSLCGRTSYQCERSSSSVRAQQQFRANTRIVKIDEGTRL